MAKQVGWLEPTKGRAGDGYMGEIAIAGIVGEIALAPVEAKRKDTSPDYRVQIKGRLGWADYGAAWIKSPRSGQGEDFLSLSIDHETLPRAVNVAAFPPSEDGDNGQWQIVWGRPRGGAVAAAAGGSAPDDEIPF